MPIRRSDNDDITSRVPRQAQVHFDMPDNDGLRRRQSSIHSQATSYAVEGYSFTIRGVLVGLCVGILISFANVYYGLQTGWISGMAMPSALIGYAFFKTLSRHLTVPFSPIENVLIQSVAGSVGTMPLGCGFVGVIPALGMMTPAENGPISLGTWKLILWGLGLCFFGVVFAVPLRKQVIIREKLRFPSGTASALMIGVLHGKETKADGPVAVNGEESEAVHAQNSTTDIEEEDKPSLSSWRAKVKLLLISFAISGFLTVATYFVPPLRKLPVFGYVLAENWLWTFNPSLGYIGQGIIMGPAITTHMLLGAIVGWGVLSPLAKYKGWAPGPIKDWETGSKGWIVWISLAIMLVDAVINLGYIALRPVVLHGPEVIAEATETIRRKDWKGLAELGRNKSYGYDPVVSNDDSFEHSAESDGALDGPSSSLADLKHGQEPDAPPEQLVNTSTVWIGLVLSIAFCILTIHLIFGRLVPLYASIVAVMMALLLSIMGVRAMGETDLNPVSGISKLAQLFFALIIPQSNKNSVLINLIAGAISEAGALQAGDLLQDLKAGHLLGAAPNAQFWAQIIGSAVGAVSSALIYQLYTNVYHIPGDQFQVPTGYVWIFTARLVTGKGLPYMAAEWAFGAAAIFSCITVLRIYATGKSWYSWIPGGIAFAVGRSISDYIEGH